MLTKIVLSNELVVARAFSSLDMKNTHEKINFQQNIYRKPTGYFDLLHQQGSIEVTTKCNKYIAIFECFILKLTIQELSVGKLVAFH